MRASDIRLMATSPGVWRDLRQRNAPMPAATTSAASGRASGPSAVGTVGLCQHPVKWDSLDRCELSGAAHRGIDRDPARRIALLLGGGHTLLGQFGFPPTWHSSWPPAADL